MGHILRNLVHYDNYKFLLQDTEESIRRGDHKMVEFEVIRAVI